MEATLSAILESTPPIASNAITENVYFWIKLISMFSTFFAISTAFILAVLFYLTWSNNQQRKRAEDVLKEMTELKEDSIILNGLIKKWASQIKKNNSVVQKLSDKVAKKVKLTDNELEELAEKRASLNQSLDNLADVSSMTPSVSQSASPQLTTAESASRRSTLLDILKGGQLVSTPESDASVTMGGVPVIFPKDKKGNEV